MREKTAAMYRIRNEERWILRSLERTFQVAQRVVLFDDGSTDATEAFAVQSLGIEAEIVQQKWGGWIGKSEDGQKELHFLHSPFTGDVRPGMRVNEIRDKNFLLYYLKQLNWTYCLAMDGDEWISLDFIRHWPEAIRMMNSGIDILHAPFLYLWGDEQTQRCDAIYGPGVGADKTLCFPRIFTIQRVDSQHLFNMHFRYLGQAGGFHCGSIGREEFRVNGNQEPKAGTFPHLIAHGGYIDSAIRAAKFKFYTTIDKDETGAEGGYLHIIERPNKHAPGPVKLAPYKDA